MAIGQSRRRSIVIGLFLATAVGRRGLAQQPRIARIGVLLSGTQSAADARVVALRNGLHEVGYVDGQNIRIEPRWSDRREQLDLLATELVHSGIDILVTQGSPAALAARRASATVPIVMATSGDPVKIGLAQSLARPGGNITGQTTISAALAGKRLELLREIVPTVSRIAVLWNSSNPGTSLQFRATEVAARKLGIVLEPFDIRDSEQLEGAIASAAKAGAGALLVLDDPIFSVRRTSIAEIAAKIQLPAMYGLSTSTQNGGLISYGPSLIEMFRGAATYVDRILKGAQPADLPIEQPTKFELVINMGAAKALGLSVPQSILLRADRVIE